MRGVREASRGLVNLAPTERLHHIGIVVPSIQSTVRGFADRLEMEWDGVIFHDPVQTVQVTFLRHRLISAPMIELVEPASPDSRVNRFLMRGGGLHHLCYEVESLATRLESALSKGSVMLSEPKPAVAFGYRQIAWICTPEKILIEYLQHSPPCTGDSEPGLSQQDEERLF